MRPRNPMGHIVYSLCFLTDNVSSIRYIRTCMYVCTNVRMYMCTQVRRYVCISMSSTLRWHADSESSILLGTRRRDKVLIIVFHSNIFRVFV